MSHVQTNELIETQQLTTFHENSSVVKNDVRDVMPYTETLTQLVDNNDVTDFLGRPQIVANGFFQTSDVQNAVLSSGSIATLLEAQQIWYRKIAGYRMIRGNAHLRIAINGNPFQQGRLLLHFLPCERDYSSYNTVYRNVHNVNLCQKTQQPCIEIDVQETSAELKIPYVAPTMFYDRVNGQFDWGTYYLSVLSPLKTGSGGQNALEYTIFLYFTEVQLSGPIFGPESKMANARLASEKKKIVRTGEISSLLDKVSDASGIFHDVPVIGGVMQSLSTYAGKFAEAFSIFGWSKPNSDQTATIATINPTRNFVNCDGENMGDVFALNHSGALPIVSGFAGTDIDEMSFAYLKKIKAFVDNFDWATSQVQDTSLFVQDVGPKNIGLFGSDTSGSSTVFYASAPPFVWLARFFKYYRGGIKYTFKLVKTPFHSGRLSVTFSTQNSNVSNSGSTYVLREIVDIRTTNEFSIVIPYIRATNYIETDFGDIVLDEYSTLGRMQIKVLNELRAPETASTSIKILVYVSAADDFELAYPQNTRSISFAAESGLAGDMKMQDTAIGSSKHEVSNIHNNNMSIADVFTSIKQLTNSYRRIFFPSYDRNTFPFIKLWPFTLTQLFTANPTVYPCMGDYLSELASGFVLSRGSVRLTYPSNTTSSIIRSHLVSENRSLTSNAAFLPYNISISSIGSTFSQLYSSFSFAKMEFSKNGQWGTEVTIPHYGQTPSRLNYYGDQVPDAVDINDCRVAFEFAPVSGALPVDYNPLLDIYRSGGDDYCLGYFIGFAPFTTLINFP